MYYRVEQMLFHLRTLTYFSVVLHIHLTYYVINISLFKLKKKKKEYIAFSELSYICDCIVKKQPDRC